MTAISAARSPVDPIGTSTRRRTIDRGWTLTYDLATYLGSYLPAITASESRA